VADRERARRNMELYLEFGGGLGDIFYRMFHDGGYCALQALTPQDRALIVLITHNPHARELFDQHPRASQLDVRDLGYWLPSDDAVMRRRHGLPQRRSRLPAAGAPEFYPSPVDREWLNRLDGTAYVLFSVSAGLPERDVPADLVERLVELAIAHSLLPVLVGRNYSRFDRREQRVHHRGVLDLIDRLTVPGVAVAVRRSLGVVCCHSAINMLAWLLRKPQLLLYPQSVYERHIAARDQWAFGVDFEECRHARFDSLDLLPTAERFFDDIQPRRMTMLQA
jgi:ADP-heptose:LPS heptosyltransferase